MKLEKLTSENIEKLRDKQVYCFEKSVSHLSELCKTYDLYSRIAGIVDENVRNQGEFDFQGKRLTVQGMDSLKKLDWDKSGILITSDYFWDAYEALSRELAGHLTVIYYFENKETAYEMEYRKHCRNAKLENIMIFRSGPHASSYIEGTDFSDNARALFEHMLAEGYDETWKLVWLVKDPKAFEKRRRKNVEFLSFDWSVSDMPEERDRYYHALCLAKYIFFTDAYGFARNCRSDQTRIQLWHGCGFKTRVNFVRCEKRYEYTTVISDIYAEIHERIYGLNSRQLLVTGYAKQDWLFHMPEKEYREWLGLQEGMRCIFWLPTFRAADTALFSLSEYQRESDTGLPVVSSFERLKMLNALLEREHIILVIKLHPFQDKNSVNCGHLSNIILLDNHELYVRDIQINRLLPLADALISDYSSAAVDYLLLNRPIAFTLEDVEEYAQSRGFIFDPIQEWLPGKEIFTFEDFCEFIIEVSHGKDSMKEKREGLMKKMHKYHDGNNCERIIEALGIKKERKKDHEL